jgi:hypothetical protein
MIKRLVCRRRKSARFRPLFNTLCILLILSGVYYTAWIYPKRFCEEESERRRSINGALSWETQLIKILEDYTIFDDTEKTVAHGILIVSDTHARSKYEQQANALQCYANRHRYVFRILDPNEYSLCFSIDNFFFQKHCAVLLYLIENRRLKWVLVLDGDNLLVNATKRIEDFIPESETTYIIHYERFYNGEIMAGNYLIRNHYWSYIYLLRWIELYKILPNIYYHNNDNGALHLHFLLMFTKNLEHVRKCYMLWRQSINETIYDQYIGCTKCALGGKRQFPHIQLLRRGHGFARDYREPENVVLENDFLLHSFKNISKIYYSQRVTEESCTDTWEPPVHEHLFVRNLTIAKQLIQYHDTLAAIRHPTSVGWPDIKNCWPTCEKELSGANEQHLLQAICR